MEWWKIGVGPELFHQGGEMVETLACKAVLVAGKKERKQEKKSSRSGNRNYCELLWTECLDK